MKWMRRKFWLTRHAIQTKFVLAVVLAMVLPSLLLSGCLYFLIFSLMAEQLALPDGVFEVLMPVFNKINVIMLIGLPFVFGIIVLAALKLSNRFAGPIDRLERDLDDILEGDIGKKLIVRDKDDLVSIMHKINRVITRSMGGMN